MRFCTLATEYASPVGLPPSSRRPRVMGEVYPLTSLFDPSSRPEGPRQPLNV